eukprot:UN24834
MQQLTLIQKNNIKTREEDRYNSAAKIENLTVELHKALRTAEEFANVQRKLLTTNNILKQKISHYEKEQENLYIDVAKLRKVNKDWCTKYKNVNEQLLQSKVKYEQTKKINYEKTENFEDCLKKFHERELTHKNKLNCVEEALNEAVTGRNMCKEQLIEQQTMFKEKELGHIRKMHENKLVLSRYEREIGKISGQLRTQSLISDLTGHKTSNSISDLTGEIDDLTGQKTCRKQ